MGRIDPVEEQDVKRLLLMLGDERIQQFLGDIVREKVKLRLTPETLKDLFGAINVDINLETLCNQLEVVMTESPDSTIYEKLIQDLKLTIQPKAVPNTAIKTDGE